MTFNEVTTNETDANAQIVNAENTNTGNPECPANVDTADCVGPLQPSLIWRKNSQHLYTSLLVFELPWPSNCLKFIPEVITGSQNEFKQKLALGTDTNGQDQEFLRICELVIPKLQNFKSLDELDHENGVLGGFNPSQTADLSILQKITAKSAIECLDLMPQNVNLIAACLNDGSVGVFDTTKFPYQPLNLYLPTMELSEVGGGGAVINWSPTVDGDLAVGGLNGQVDLYNVRKLYKINEKMEPVCSYKHETSVNDLMWHPSRIGILASVGDDNYLKVVCKPNNVSNPDIILEHKFGSKPTCLAWNPVNQSLMAVGFDDGYLELLDLRTEVISLFRVKAHEGYITKVRFNTWHPSVLATSSEDHTVKIWNAVNLELLFTHGGHNAPVTDVSWNPAVPSSLASVSEDNGLHIYEPLDQLIGF